MSWASLNAWTGQKKGETHSTLAATVIPTLVEMAPQITSAIKSKKGDAFRWCRSFQVCWQEEDNESYWTKENLIREGGAIKVVVRWVHSSRMDGIISSHGMVAMQRSWSLSQISLQTLQVWLIDKDVQHVGDKTGSDTLKQIGTAVGNMAKNTVMQLVLFKNYGTGWNGSNLIYPFHCFIH